MRKFANCERTSPSGNLTQPDFAFKFILLGDYGVGKTTLLNKLVNENRKAKHTTHNNSPPFLTSVITRGHNRIQITVVDTGGQEHFRSLTASFYRGAHGCLLLFDVTKANTFSDITFWLHDLKEYTSHPEISIILVGTKCHVPAADREVPTERAQKYAESENLSYMEVSVEDGTNVTEVVNKLADIILEKITNKQTAITFHTDRSILGPTEPKKKQICLC